MATQKKRHILPGFGVTMGYTVVYLSLLVLIPLIALVLKSLGGGPAHFIASALEPRVVASYRLSFGLSLLAALINGVFGVMLAWVLVRYRFPGRKLLDAVVDLPFALPTAVAGLALTAIYAPNGVIGQLFTWNGAIGQYLKPGTQLGAWLAAQQWASPLLGPMGLKIAYTPIGILIALIFIGLPFMVRTVQPVIADLSKDIEEAAATLGASRLRTMRAVVLPALVPSILTGMMLAFGRAVGEYGSVVFIAGNQPMISEITPLLIITKLEQFDYSGAATIGFVMLLASFAILLFVNLLQSWNARRLGYLNH